MSYKEASAYLAEKGMNDRIMEFSTSSATVELAAAAIGCAPERIAKSLTFSVNDEPVMIVCAGNAKVSNSKFKACFGTKAKMLTKDEVSERIGHDVGGVCPFGIKDGVRVYLDASLKCFDEVYPACGSSNSAVRLSLPELEQLSRSVGFVDVCHIPEEV